MEIVNDEYIDNTDDINNIPMIDKKYTKIDIEKYIYSFYPLKKQTQDEKWVSSYTTKLKAMSIENIELTVVQKAGEFFEGKTLDECLKDIPDGQVKYFSKLMKVAIRTEWAERCIEEGTLAISEQREPKYLDFPIF